MAIHLSSLFSSNRYVRLVFEGDDRETNTRPSRRRIPVAAIFVPLSVIVLILVFAGHGVTQRNAATSTGSSEPYATTHDSSSTSTSDDMSQLMQRLFKSVTHNMTESPFRIYNEEFDLPESRSWTEPLGKKICIVDTDNRPFNQPGQVWGQKKFDWNAIGYTSPGVLNHYLYALIHGYTYHYVQVPSYPTRSVFWSKIPMMSDLLLDGCRIVVAIDHDAVFQHLNLPFEWLLNRWSFTQNTSFAMALDNDWTLDSRYADGTLGRDLNADAYGELNINAGFIIAQNLPRTHDILRAWDSCPGNETVYPDCTRYLNTWPAEQGAWGTYMRRQFTLPTDRLQLPCTEANGFPSMGTECKGIFVRHFTIGKDVIKMNVFDRSAWALTELIGQHIVSREQDVKLIREKNDFTMSFSYLGGGIHEYDVEAEMNDPSIVPKKMNRRTRRSTSLP